MANKYRGKNEGSIYKRSDGSWRAQISINGERMSYSAKTKPEVLKWLQNTQFQLGQGLDKASSQLAVQEYMEQWLEANKLKLRSKTVQQYEQTARNHIYPYIGKTRLLDLSPIQVERLYAQLYASGKGIRTIRLTHGVLHSALEKAVRLRLISSNPATGATLPRLNQAEMQILDVEQVSRFLAAASSSFYEALYHLAITTGLRQAELFGLRWSDLKWNSGTLYIRRQVQRVIGQGWQFVEPKTRAGRRTIKIGEESLHRLRLHKERQGQLKLDAGKRWQDLDLIFPSSTGTPGDPSNLRKDFIRVLMEAGLPILRFHDLRHTAASLMLNHGVPVIVASKRLGHSKPSITLDIYGHLLHEMQDEAARLMDELVTPQPVDLSILHSVERFEKAEAN